jgi:hypothetical protein
MARFWKRYKGISTPEEAGALFREMFPKFRGQPSISRERIGQYGEPDDAQIMDETLFQKLKAVGSLSEYVDGNKKENLRTGEPKVQPTPDWNNLQQRVEQLERRNRRLWVCLIGSLVLSLLVSLAMCWAVFVYSATHFDNQSQIIRAIHKRLEKLEGH